MDEPKQRMKRLCLTLDAFTIAEAKPVTIRFDGREHSTRQMRP